MSANAVVAKQALREVRLLRHLGKHSNVVTLVNLHVNEKEDELYIVMELMDTDLHRIIQSSQSLTDAHHKHFMYQLIRGLRFAHRHGVIHRDLKPSNLLVTKNCDLRITDFGLSRLVPDEDDALMTEHVVTRWYRPPELMLSADGMYTDAVDIWSVGCIFAELLGRKPLFPGKNFMHQLCLIFDVIGTPPERELRFIRSEQAMQFMRSLNVIKKIPFASLFPFANPKAVDLLERMLVFDPKQRITVEDALAHPYFASVAGQYTDPDPELPPEFEFEFEKNKSLTKADLRRMLVEECEGFASERGSPADALERKDSEGGGKRGEGSSAVGGAGGAGGGTRSTSAATSRGRSRSGSRGPSTGRSTARSGSSTRAAVSRGRSWREREASDKAARDRSAGGGASSRSTSATRDYSHVSSSGYGGAALRRTGSGRSIGSRSGSTGRSGRATSAGRARSDSGGRSGARYAQQTAASRAQSRERARAAAAGESRERARAAAAAKAARARSTSASGSASGAPVVPPVRGDLARSSSTGRGVAAERGIAERRASQSAREPKRDSPEVARAKERAAERLARSLDDDASSTGQDSSSSAEGAGAVAPSPDPVAAAAAAAAAGARSSALSTGHSRSRSSGAMAWTEANRSGSDSEVAEAANGAAAAVASAVAASAAAASAAAGIAAPKSPHVLASRARAGSAESEADESLPVAPRGAGGQIVSGSRVPESPLRHSPVHMDDDEGAGSATGSASSASSADEGAAHRGAHAGVRTGAPVSPSRSPARARAQMLSPTRRLAGQSSGAGGVAAASSRPRSRPTRSDVVAAAMAAADSAIAGDDGADVGESAAARASGTVPRPFSFATNERERAREAAAVAAAAAREDVALSQWRRSGSNGTSRPSGADDDEADARRAQAPTAVKPFRFATDARMSSRGSTTARERSASASREGQRILSRGRSAGNVLANAEAALAAALGQGDGSAPAPAADDARRRRARKTTVPKSPNFSKMSWERRGGRPSVPGDGAGGAGGMSGRSTSAAGHRATSASRVRRAGSSRGTFGSGVRQTQIF